MSAAKRHHILGAQVVLALLVLGGFQWHNRRSLRRVQDRPSDPGEPAAHP